MHGAPPKLPSVREATVKAHEVDNCRGWPVKHGQVKRQCFREGQASAKFQNNSYIYRQLKFH